MVGSTRRTVPVKRADHADGAQPGRLAFVKAQEVGFGHVGAQFQRAVPDDDEHRLARPPWRWRRSVALRATILPATGAFTSVRLSCRSTFSSRASASASCARDEFQRLPGNLYPRCRRNGICVGGIGLRLRRGALFAQISVVRSATRCASAALASASTSCASAWAIVAAAAASDATASVAAGPAMTVDRTRQHLTFGHRVADVSHQSLKRLALDQGGDLHLLDRGRQGPRR